MQQEALLYLVVAFSMHLATSISRVRIVSLHGGQGIATRILGTGTFKTSGPVKDILKRYLSKLLVYNTRATDTRPNM